MLYGIIQHYVKCSITLVHLRMKAKANTFILLGETDSKAWMEMSKIIRFRCNCHCSMESNDWPAKSSFVFVPWKGNQENEFYRWSTYVFTYGWMKKIGESQSAHMMFELRTRKMSNDTIRTVKCASELRAKFELYDFLERLRNRKSGNK